MVTVDGMTDLIEMNDGQGGAWVVIASKTAVKMSDSTWELALVSVHEDDTRRFRINGGTCSWHLKVGEDRVLVRSTSASRPRDRSRAR